MNILFCNVFEVSPFQGGTERITHKLSQAFRNTYKYKCFSAYHIKNKDSSTNSYFDGKIQITSKTLTKELTQFIQKNKINYIIIQGAFNDVILFRKAINEIKTCKIIFAHHFEPMAEKQFFLFQDFLYDALKYKTLKKIIKLLISPILRRNYLKKLPYQYHNAYKYSDATVLLTKEFINPYIKYARLTEGNKFICIPNMLSYDEFCSSEELENKDQTILIVSRFDERFKRLLLALKIWKKLKQQQYAKEWNLKIIGSGNDYSKYLKYIKQENIKDVYFLGKQDPREYYKKASLFLMTSKSESWGLTITEAQQFGVIPIAFDCFPSLKEIIINKYNGFIIPDKQIDQYIIALNDLLKNEQERKEIARNCISSSKRFSEEIIIQKWKDLLFKLKYESDL